MSAPIYVYPKACAICGRPALYIVPPEGRCREHKYTVSAAVLAERRRREGWVDPDDDSCRYGSRERSRRDVAKLRTALRKCKRGHR